MGDYFKLLLLEVDDSIKISTDNGNEIFKSKDVRQILVRKKKKLIHSKLVYLAVFTLFLIISVLMENFLYLLGFLISIVIMSFMPKYQYYIKFNFAITSKKYRITEKQYYAYKPIAQQFNQAHKSTHA